VLSLQDRNTWIAARFAHLIEPDYPRFSAQEMASRRQRVTAACGERGLDAVLVVQSLRAGTATFWLTGWPVTQEAVTLIVPGRRQTMFIQHYNHLPLARRLAAETEVAWGEASGLGRALEELDRTVPGAARLGVIGLLPAAGHAALAARAAEIVDLNGAYARMRLIKSAEELDWMRLGAALTDLAVAALAEGARPGMSEHDLAALTEAPYVALGGSHGIHFFLATAMGAPDMAVPAQIASARRLQTGDALACEVSVQFWDYAGQLLRTFAIAAEPSALHRELYQVAEAAFEAVVARLRPGTHVSELVEAAGLIEEAGFTVWDDLVHGYGGGYLPPVLGSKSRPAAGGIPDLQLEAGMTLVVQPNVVTRDARAGVQTGELMLITEDGAESLHDFPRGLKVLGGPH
jgi:Xaa-Pro dipeptidase